MIVFDFLLIMTAGIFFTISWLYAWGMLQIFGLNHAWDLASVVGIASIVSCTYALVWVPRIALGYEPFNDLVQIPLDLAIVFLAALPGMTYHRYQLNKKRDREINEAILELSEIKKLAIQALEDRRDMKEALQNILIVLQWHSEAMSILNEREYREN